MDVLARRIKIIPIAKCLPHEKIVPRWVHRLALSIQKDGILKNPIIVTPHRGHYVILDGMHRFAALAELKIPDILVYEVDYFSKSVVLKPPHTKREILERGMKRQLLPPKSTTHIIFHRPLRIDLNLALLRAKFNLKAKNQKLQAHLENCRAQHHVRFYPESVYLFAD